MPRPDRLLAVLLMFFAIVAAAAPPASGPIHIEADWVELDDARGVSVFRGDVHMTRGAMVIDAAEVTLYRTEEALQRAVATGEPARFRQTTEDGRLVRGEAGYMEYLAGGQRVTLRGSAHLWREKDEFRGDEIVYDIGGNRVVAAGESDGEGRVRALIFPEEDQDGAEAKPQ